MTSQSNSSSGADYVGVGDLAPDFNLQSIQGEEISLALQPASHWTLLWFSRGFTCNFCRGYMDELTRGYADLNAANVNIIQVAPNLHDTASRYFGSQPPPYPFVCDPDKRLYALYGLGDAGALTATRNTIVSFSTAFRAGDGMETVRASFLDVANRNFMRRLHHHALSAMEQGIFFVDQQTMIRYRSILNALSPIPTTDDLLTIHKAIV